MATDRDAERGRFVRQTYRQVVDLIPQLERALGKLGISIKEMSDRWERDGDKPISEDRRADISRSAAMADLMTKIIAVEGHPEFPKLAPHLELMAGKKSFIQHYFTPKEDDAGNKTYELYVAAVAMLAGCPVDLDHPVHSAGGKNPDIITTFKNVRWGLACKVLNAPEPRGYRNHLLKGIEQIELAENKQGPVHRGVVLFNLKNVVPYDAVWPILKDEITGTLDYRYFNSAEEPQEIATSWAKQSFYDPVIDEFGGQKDVDEVFKGKKAVPVTLNFVPVITGCMDHGHRTFAKLNIYKKLTFGTAPPETEAFLRALAKAGQLRAEKLTG
jgi:hypothetical protein